MKTNEELENLISNERSRITIMGNQIDYLIKEIRKLNLKRTGEEK